MSWGSTWEFTDYTRQNWWNLWLESPKSAGGSQFAGQSEPEKKQPNPFLRVQTPQNDLPERIEPAQGNILSPSTEARLGNSSKSDTNEFLYATETFDRQQLGVSPQANSRWSAGHQGLHVPVLDDRLTVAFQKFLRDEESEFLLLMIAMESGDNHA